MDIASYLDPDTSLDVDEYSRKLARRAINIFAVDGSIDVAHMAFYLPSESMFVTSLSVLPIWRQLGVAKHLLQIGETIATSMGRAKIELETTITNNRALMFYAKNGFEPDKSLVPTRFILTKHISIEN